MYIELDDTLQKNLITFMQRVQLTGSEVPEFNKIMAALTKPVEFPESVITLETDK